MCPVRIGHTHCNHFFFLSHGLQQTIIFSNTYFRLCAHAYVGVGVGMMLVRGRVGKHPWQVSQLRGMPEGSGDIDTTLVPVDKMDNVVERLKSKAMSDVVDKVTTKNRSHNNQLLITWSNKLLDILFLYTWWCMHVYTREIVFFFSSFFRRLNFLSSSVGVYG